MRKTVSQEHKRAMVEAYLSGKSLSAAAAQSGFTTKACLNALMERGIERRSWNIKTVEVGVPQRIQDAMVAEYLAGESSNTVGARYGYSGSSCIKALKRRGITPRKHSGGVLESEKDAMVKAYQEGATADEAGALFGYSDKACFTALKERGIDSRPSVRRDAASINLASQIAADHQGGMTVKELGEKYGRTGNPLRKILRKQGVYVHAPNGRIKQITEKDCDAMVAAYLDGVSSEQAGQRFGWSGSACLQALVSRGIKARPLEKLTAEQKIEVCQRYAAGESSSTIGDALTLSSTTILKAVKSAGIIPRATGSTSRKYDVDHNYFASIDTEEKAYWLGFLAADGSVCSQGSTRIISLTLQGRDADHVYKFKESIKAENPFKESRAMGKPYVGIHVVSRQLAADLEVHGVMPRKTFLLRWPMSLPHELHRHYLRGYFDGDGCWSARPSLRNPVFSMVGNEDFISESQKFLIRECDLSQTKLSRPRNTKVVSVAYSSFAAATKIAHLLYDGATIYLPRKKEKVIHLL